MRKLRSLYFEIDLRTLAVLRIGLGLLLLFDLAKRVPGAGLWYVNSGLLPNHRVLWHPAPYQFSYMFAFWTVTQVRVAFAVIAVVYACFLIGYRTRLFHVLSWLTVLSLHTRANFVANGGEYVLCTLLLWTAFMPLGARWSVDCPRPRAQLAEPMASGGEDAPAVFASLSVAALQIQLCVIYLFNALNKTGETWRDGSAVHYMLHQARIVTPLGIWVREHAPSAALRALAYGTLVVEYAIPILIVMPWLRPWTRRLAIFLIWSLHASIAALANLGVFSPAMMVFALCLLGSEDVRWLGSRRWIVNACKAVAVRARFAVDQTAGAESQPSGGSARAKQADRRLNVVRVRFREACIAFLALCATSQLINENTALLGKFEHEQPLPMNATIDYLRLNQGWSMFAPDAPLTDAWIVVDAVTQSGRHIDPYNIRASQVADPKLRTIPPRLAQNVYFCNYTSRIPDEEQFHEPFRDWILHHGKRVHRADENVVHFDAYLIEHQSPPLGKHEPTETTARLFLSGDRDD